MPAGSASDSGAPGGAAGVEEGAGFHAERGEVHLRLPVGGAARDGDAETGGLDAPAGAPAVQFRRADQAAGELVGVGAAREGEVGGGQGAQRGDGVVAESGGESADDADERGDEDHHAPHEEEAAAGRLQFEQGQVHGRCLPAFFCLRDTVSPR